MMAEGVQKILEIFPEYHEEFVRACLGAYEVMRVFRGSGGQGYLGVPGGKGI